MATVGARTLGPMKTPVRALGTIMGIWAHPDDEAYLSGGLMALARANGQRVVCVTATRGELGTADPLSWPPERLAAERTRELADCLAILGVQEHHWLAYRDGGCAAADAPAAVAQLGDLIAQVRPDTLLTFGPDGLTGHADHQAVSAWAGAAFAEAAPGARLLHATVPQRRTVPDDELGIYAPGYPITTPDAHLAVDLVLEPGVAALKAKALAAQATQTSGLIATLGLDTYTAWVGEESFVESARRVLDVVNAC
jgi:LmbE family N-acetylglucosaminyl deacetylase